MSFLKPKESSTPAGEQSAAYHPKKNISLQLPRKKFLLMNLNDSVERANNSILMNESSFKLKAVPRMDKLDFNGATDDSKRLQMEFKTEIRKKNRLLQRFGEESETIPSQELDPNALFRLGSAGKAKYVQHYKQLDRIIELDIVNQKELGPVTNVLQKQRKFRLFPSALGLLNDAAADSGVLNIKF